MEHIHSQGGLDERERAVQDGDPSLERSREEVVHPKVGLIIPSTDLHEVAIFSSQARELPEHHQQEEQRYPQAQVCNYGRLQSDP